MYGQHCLRSCRSNGPNYTNITIFGGLYWHRCGHSILVATCILSGNWSHCVDVNPGLVDQSYQGKLFLLLFWVVQFFLIFNFNFSILFLFFLLVVLLCNIKFQIFKYYSVSTCWIDGHVFCIKHFIDAYEYAIRISYHHNRSVGWSSI